MKIKISNDNPTQYVLVAMLNYNLIPDFELNDKYGFGYFELDDRPVLEINRFLDHWENGPREFGEVVIHLNEFYLIDQQFIEDAFDNCKNSDWKGVRMDGINFISEKLVSDPSFSLEAIGTIHVCQRSFMVWGEAVSIQSRCPKIIYKSDIVSYWMINHLLKRKRPI